MHMALTSSRGWRGRVLAFTVGLLLAGGAVAQSPAPDAKSAKPAAKGQAAAKPAKKPAAPVYKMEVEPRAMDLLKAMSARLAAAKSLSFTAVVGYEFPSRLGPPIVYTTRYDVAMQRPDHLWCSCRATGRRPSSITTARR